MSDDIVTRLLICAKYDPDQKDAADEITRLRADLAAARELLKEARKLIARCDPQDFFNMLARIDAALKGDGDE